MEPEICESCWHYDYDEALDAFFCRMELDEDEYRRIFSLSRGRCPFYRPGNEYDLPRRQ